MHEKNRQIYESIKVVVEAMSLYANTQEAGQVRNSTTGSMKKNLGWIRHAALEGVKGSSYYKNVLSLVLEIESK